MTRVAHLFSVHRMTAIMVGDEIMVGPSSDDYEKVVFTWNVETIEAFSSCAVQVRAERAHTGWTYQCHDSGIEGWRWLLCHRVLLYKICTQSRDKVVRMQSWW